MRNETLSADVAWRAVADRDGRYDGRFVYAVRTTGIYCRPSCPSRRPSHQHVRFFGGPDAAERAGFRACKRCHPRDAAAPRSSAVERARRWIDGHVDAPLRLTELAEVAGVSPAHLQRTFTRALGVSPKAYHEARRAERLRAQLKGGTTVSRAIFDAGYGSGSRVYERAAGTLGMTPGRYRRGGAGVAVHFSITGTPFGRLLVATTPRGVCSVELGDDDGALEERLRTELPNATVARGDATHRDWVGHIVASLRGERSSTDIPLDVQGTAFQWQVWRALQRIPRGQTRSYSDVAREIGRPNANRAVARACASNRAALVIPCHRVVREDGSLGGYRWGLERKAKLLEAEQAGRA